MPPPSYLAVIVYVSSCPSEDYVPLYEECFVLLAASSVDEAMEKAVEHAREQETSYANEFGETITWRLERVEGVNSLLYDGFEHGTQLHARHFRNYEAYRRFRDEEL